MQTITIAPPKRSWFSLLSWAVVLAVLVVSWQGAEMAPLTLIKDGGNMATFAADFFPPDFSQWQDYLTEMAVTLQIAVWGTALAVVLSIPFGLMSAENLVPWWVYQPVRRLMDACRAINEMVFAMLFVVAVGLGRGHQGGAGVVDGEDVEGDEGAALAEGGGAGERLRRDRQAGAHRGQGVVGPLAVEVLQGVEQHGHLVGGRGVQLVEQEQQARPTARPHGRGGVVQQGLQDADRRLRGSGGLPAGDVGLDLRPRKPDLDRQPLELAAPPAPGGAGRDGVRSLQRPSDAVRDLREDRLLTRAGHPGRDEPGLRGAALAGTQQRRLADATGGVEHEQRSAELAEGRHPGEQTLDAPHLRGPAGEDPRQLAGGVGIARHDPSAT